MGYIYAISESKDGPTKIGCTVNNVASRLHAIQTGHYRTLSVVALVEVDNKHMHYIEGSLHEKLESYSLRGEWFSIGVTQEYLESMIHSIDKMPDVETDTEDILNRFHNMPETQEPNFTYTYGTEEQEIEITINGPDVSQSLSLAKTTLEYYLSIL